MATRVGDYVTAFAMTIYIIAGAPSLAAEPDSRIDPARTYAIWTGTRSGPGGLVCVNGRVVVRHFEAGRQKELPDLPRVAAPDFSSHWKLELADAGVSIRVLEDDATKNRGYLTFDKAHPERGVHLSEKALEGSYWKVDLDHLKDTTIAQDGISLHVVSEAKSYVMEGGRRGVASDFPVEASQAEASKFEIYLVTVPLPASRFVVFRQLGGLLGNAGGDVGLIHSKNSPGGNLEALPERATKLSTTWTTLPRQKGILLKCRDGYLSLDKDKPEEGLYLVEKEEDAVFWAGVNPPVRGVKATRIRTRIEGKDWGICTSSGIDRFFTKPARVVSVRAMTLSDDPDEWTTFDCEEPSP